MTTNTKMPPVQIVGNKSLMLADFVSAMREWLLDTFEDAPDFIWEMDADEIRQTIDVIYVGGLSQFIADGCHDDAI
jgi:hypothetical protein